MGRAAFGLSGAASAVDGSATSIGEHAALSSKLRARLRLALRPAASVRTPAAAYSRLAGAAGQHATTAVGHVPALRTSVCACERRALALTRDTSVGAVAQTAEQALPTAVVCRAALGSELRAGLGDTVPARFRSGSAVRAGTAPNDQQCCCQYQKEIRDGSDGARALESQHRLPLTAISKTLVETRHLATTAETALRAMAWQCSPGSPVSGLSSQSRGDEQLRGSRTGEPAYEVQ